jgi:myo-inositol-1-phosphate synthase
MAVLVPGMGAVGTTMMAGVLAASRGVAEPIGSLAEYGRVQSDGTSVPLRQVIDLAELDDLVFGGWDIFEDSAYQAARTAGVLSERHLDLLRDELEAIEPMPAVFDRNFVRNLDGSNVKPPASKMEWAEALMDDIDAFMTRNECARGVGIWCGSTEVHVDLRDVHLSLEAFEQGLRDSHPAISPTMIYAYAHLRMGLPFVNAAPNRALDAPALVELAEREGVPVAGKDLKTGQTLMKTILAPGLAARKLKVRGWYSTNILGNRDGAVLDDPGSFRTKEQSKLSVLESILDKREQPDLYGDIQHKVRIDYYPPRGDNKEGWDNIDFSGWMDYPMEIKINFLCRDSILAAPLVLDLALFSDLAKRRGMAGPQEWLSFYFKSPQVRGGEMPVHDLFAQYAMLTEQLETFADEASGETYRFPSAESERPAAEATGE